MEPMASSNKSKTTGVGIASFMSNLSMSSSSSVSVTIDDLPPEVLEKIIDRLDDRASILNCRVVNSEWKAAAGKAMENLCLSGWTRWKLRGIPEQTQFPKIGRTPIFPFPTRCLYFNYLGWEEYKKTNKAAKIDAFQLLKLFGSHLTSLWIEGIPLDPIQISIMFKELVNLKALTISEADKRKWDATAELTTKPPPNLQYLRLMLYSIHLAQWIVDQCSSQLIGLETFGTYPDSSTNWNEDDLKLPSSSGTNHLRFTKLKLWGVSSGIFEQTVRLPLTHLSVDFPYDVAFRDITLKNIITFLNNFSGTLVQLYLEILLEQREDGGIIPFNEFSRLTKLYIWFLCPSVPDRNRLAYLHEVFLKRFPNLQRLHLLSQASSRKEREMEQVREELNTCFRIQHCFQLCKKLETVTVEQEFSKEDSLESQIYEITVSRDGDQLWKRR